MLGVELVTDRELKTPAKAETLHVMDQLKGKINNPLICTLVLASFLLYYKLIILLYYRIRGTYWQGWLLWKCLQSYTPVVFHKRRCW